jgi:trehalose 6-phosphate synthase
VDAVVHDAWQDGYVAVNRAFAQAVIEEAQATEEPPVMMLHDYHLYLTPGYIREAIPGAIIQHFIHIPWPTPVYWRLIPSYMRRAICESLCSADVVGFQTSQDVRNFLDSCEEFLPEARVDHNERVVYFGDQRTLVKAYPVSIDVEEIRRIANSVRAQEYERKLRPLCNEKTIVRVDRAEPSKNIVRGFRAFGLLLNRYPEFQGRVNLLAFLVPSRTHIRQYQRYMEDIDRAVQEINNAFGTPDWQPIITFYENNYVQAVAGMKLYDVLLVNSVVDGMNLVAKEGPVVNTRGGVLILSETTGAFAQLREGALSVSPTDVEGTMQALYQALTMDAEERERRATILVQAIEREDVTHWLEQQLEDLCALL